MKMFLSSSPLCWLLAVGGGCVYTVWCWSNTFSWGLMNYNFSIHNILSNFFYVDLPPPQSIFIPQPFLQVRPLRIPAHTFTPVCVRAETRRLFMRTRIISILSSIACLSTSASIQYRFKSKTAYLWSPHRYFNEPGEDMTCQDVLRCNATWWDAVRC